MSGDAAAGARCLRRGLGVLAELNRRRMAGAAEIAAAIGVPRPTVHRLLLALAADGYACHVAGTDQFACQAAVTTLAAGWDAAARGVAIAAPLTDEAADATGWPIDVTLFDAGTMLVRHSTHDRVGWSLLPRSPAGHRLPLAGTAPGRMYLAGLGDGERQAWLADQPAPERRAVDEAARRGFAVRDGGILPRTTSIAVPVRSDGTIVLCISMAFIRASTVLDTVIAAHVPTLHAIARATERAIDPAAPALRRAPADSDSAPCRRAAPPRPPARSHLR